MLLTIPLLSMPSICLLLSYSSIQTWIQKAALQLIYNENFYETKLFSFNKAVYHCKYLLYSLLVLT